MDYWMNEPNRITYSVSTLVTIMTKNSQICLKRKEKKTKKQKQMSARRFTFVCVLRTVWSFNKNQIKKRWYGKYEGHFLDLLKKMLDKM